MRGKGRRSWRAVWDGRYLFSPGMAPDNFHSLFDHQTDPYEMRNLIDSPDHVEEKKRMKRLLLDLASSAKDPMLEKLRKACGKA